MSLTNIIQARWIDRFEYSIEFQRPDTSGFSFPCSADGTPLFTQMTEPAIKNYSWCLQHPEEFPTCYDVFKRVRHRYKEPAEGDCVCGARVQLIDQYMGACQCQCGRWYNLFGQSLVPPSQWEEQEGDDY